MVSTQADTSQVGELDSDSLIFLFSGTTLTVGYSGDSEWILETYVPIMYVLIGIDFLSSRS